MKVCISGSERRRNVLVDFVYFLENTITLVPVDFIPDSGKNFMVEIEPNGGPIVGTAVWQKAIDLSGREYRKGSRINRV